MPINIQSQHSSRISLLIGTCFSFGRLDPTGSAKARIYILTSWDTCNILTKRRLPSPKPAKSK
ncbi:hypothetical protein C8R44DRAFT_37694 [Mycena epipterygia]|nr:hypothetical protein C8R44DRAFT_37694 [Mycena epipterygia]